jgi:hypothetical protein
MPLEPGTSFLNIGSGTGYFNSLVSEVIGDLSTNHGVEIWEETVEHARCCCERLDKNNIEFIVGNVYELDIHNTMRYDRIYLGACANSRSKYLYQLLEVGGILVGPFQAGRSQQLRRVVRESETEFSVQVLESVRFATLVEPSATGSAPFALHERPWTLERRHLCLPSFRMAAATVFRGQHDLPLPKEIWSQHILPFCSKRWFEHSEPRRSSTQVLPSLAVDVPTEEQALKGSVDDDSISEFGGSTCAPRSSIASSMASSPQSSPDQDPLDFGDDVMFEVFSNGQRHIIGAEGDPDDVDASEEEVVHFQVLQLLAMAAQARAAEEENAGDPDGENTVPEDLDDFDMEILENALRLLTDATADGSEPAEPWSDIV